MIILGISAYHPDAAAALIVDGEIKAAVAEERYSRNKHEGGLPKHAIHFCLSQSPREPDVIAVGRDPSCHRLRKGLALIKYPKLVRTIRNKTASNHQISSIQYHLREIIGRDIPVRSIEHHASHLAYAYATSPFPSCALLSLDGFGDFASAAWGRGANNKIDIAGRVFFPHSLGILYTAVTQFLGFDRFGEEYKVMALAAYGTPRYTKEINQLIWRTPHGFSLNIKAFEHVKRFVSMNQEVAYIERLWSQDMFNVLLGKERKREEEITQQHKDIAASLQCVTNEIILHCCNIIKQKTNEDNLALAGGVALNSVANGMISRSGLFNTVWIGSAPADDGTAIGAAAFVAMKHKELHIPWNKNSSPFLGPSHKDSSSTPRLFIGTNGWKVSRIPNRKDFYEKIIDLLSKGNIIGWHEGAMEFGPRALGHRSILADPRNPKIKAKINATIKKRESFRPFAPMVLEEDVNEYFKLSQASPNMMIVAPIRYEWQGKLPAICHYDGSARIQTVNKRLLPNIANLLKLWKQETGVSVLLNTSFNENEPIVNTPEQAIACAKRSGIDIVALL